MRGVQWAIYLWPGLPGLWWRGAWSGLALAVSFALLLNLVVAATLVWGELLGPQRAGAIWSGFIAGWLALLFVSRRAAPLAEASPTGPNDLFPAALAEYLRGNWLDAELLARQLVAQIPTDVVATLLLAATLRHTNRFDEARETLDGLTLWDRAASWQMEIIAVYQRLSEKEIRLAEGSQQPSIEECAVETELEAPDAGGSEQTEHNVLESEEPRISLPDWRRAA
jgi:hypothetical protein